MTNPIESDTPNPEAAIFTRRCVVRMASGLGLAATSAVAFGTAGAKASNTSPTASPAVPGGFGQPPTNEEALASQRWSAAMATHGQTYVKSGVVSAPESTSAAGARLKPSATTIDSTPLAQRRPGFVWSVRE